MPCDRVVKPLKTIRAFLAIPLRGELLKKEIEYNLAALKKQEGAKNIRWIKYDDLHLTVSFLGQMPLSLVANLTVTLRKQLKDRKPFVLELTKIDFFPPQRHPRVIALFIKPNPSLMALSHILDKIGTDYQFPVEWRPFYPHITLGRLRRRIPQLDFSAFKINMPLWVNQLILYESRLDETGRRYEIRKKVLFKISEKYLI